MPWHRDGVLGKLNLFSSLVASREVAGFVASALDFEWLVLGMQHAGCDVMWRERSVVGTRRRNCQQTRNEKRLTKTS